MRTKKYQTVAEFFFKDFFRKLGIKKILILSISVACGVACSLLLYLFSNYRLEQNDEQKIEFLVKNPPIHLFALYEKFSIQYNCSEIITKKCLDINLNKEFFNIFEKNLLNLNTLVSFAEKNEEFKDFKEFLKSKNITTLQYFQDNGLQIVNKKNKNIEGNYFLFLPKKLDASTFLKNYIKFIQKNTTIELKKYFKLIIEDEIKIHHDALKIAKIIGLKNHIQFEINSKMKIEILSKDLYQYGSEILSQKIIFLENFLEQLENEEFNYNMILDGPTITQPPPPSLLYFLSSGLLFGLLIFFIIIYFKKILNN
jgi:hypothetical protein